MADFGAIGSKQGAPGIPINTLDEPISETILRDLRQVGDKLRIVIISPFTGRSEDDIVNRLRNWDLWGPLLICLSLSIVLSFRAPKDQTAIVFAAAFVVVWLGASLVTVNAQLLGGNICFFQSVCVLGYCVFPLTLAALLVLVLHWFIHNSVVYFLLAVFVVACGFLWSTKASVVFMDELVQVVPDKRLLAVYPVLLFYGFISWLVLSG
eukprot:438465_1